MCQYRYVYYARCHHAEFYLVSYCSKARARAGLSRTVTPCRDAAGGAQSSPHSGEQLGLSDDSHAQDEVSMTPKGADWTKHALGDEATREEAQSKDAVEQIVPPQQRTPQTTWASIARAASGPVAAGSVRRTSLPKDGLRVTSAETALSPAARLAARFEHDSSNPAVDNTKSSRASYQTTQQTSISGSKKRGEVERVERGSSSSTSPTTPRHGRNGSDQTIRAGKRTQAGLPDQPEPQQPDVNSATDFPELSQNSIGRSSHIPDRVRSGSSASWAQVAGLTSASRPNRSSISDPTAESDAGTVSTSLSSFQSDPFDYVTLDKVDSPKMTFERRTTMAKAIRFRKPAPANVNDPWPSDAPRKRLPAEWTWKASSSPERSTPTVNKRKSTGTLGAAWDSSNETHGTRPKSPTKTMPFELATARRAAMREQREKTGTAAKIPPVVPKTLSRGKTTPKSHSKSLSSGSASTAQLHTAHHSPFPSSSTQGFATAPEDPHHKTSAPRSPSRIPRLALRGGRSSVSWPSEPELSPIRSETRVEVEVSETASGLQLNIQTTPSPPEKRLGDISESDSSLETIKPDGDMGGTVAFGEEQEKSTGVQDARFEMVESNAAIKRASATVENIQGREHVDSHVHFIGKPETTDKVSGLGIECGSPVIQSEESQEPTRILSVGWKVPEYFDDHEARSQTSSSQAHLALHGVQERTRMPVSDASVSDATFKFPQPNKTKEVEETQLGQPQTPETRSTGPGISGSSGTHGSDIERSAYHVEEDRESTIFRQPGYRLSSASSVSTGATTVRLLPVEEHTNTLTSNNGSRSISQYERERSSSTRSELAAHPDSTRHLNLGSKLDMVPGTEPSFSTGIGSLQGNVTAPSRLNAQAQEFVPGGTFAMGNTHGHTRPQMPLEWTDTGFTIPYAGPQYENDVSKYSSFNGPYGLSSSDKKKHKKSPKKPPQKSPNEYSGNSWNRSSENQTNTTGPLDAPPEPTGARWYIPNVSNTNQNMAYDRRPTEQQYLGRGGSRTTSQPGPDGKTPHERWWQNGWTSVNGGPLTIGAAYEHLRQQDAMHYTQGQGPNQSMYPRDEHVEYGGYGVLKPCGNVIMDGAFEALPHHPLLCSGCEPDAYHKSQ